MAVARARRKRRRWADAAMYAVPLVTASLVGAAVMLVVVLVAQL